jgi:hypothetical protein
MNFSYEQISKLDELIEKLASRHGGCEPNVQICYVGRGRWCFVYDGDFSEPCEWSELEKKIDAFCE